MMELLPNDKEKYTVLDINNFGENSQKSNILKQLEQEKNIQNLNF